MKWIIALLGNQHCGAFEISVDGHLTGKTYDPWKIHDYVTYYSQQRFEEARAIRLVDALNAKMPLAQVRGNPWDFNYLPDTRKKIDSWRMESF